MFPIGGGRRTFITARLRWKGDMPSLPPHPFLLLPSFPPPLLLLHHHLLLPHTVAVGVSATRLMHCFLLGQILPIRPNPAPKGAFKRTQNNRHA